MISQVPRLNAVNLQLITFATDDIGDTPSSPCFVNATPTPAKNNPAINSRYLLNNSFFSITDSPSSPANLHKSFEMMTETQFSLLPKNLRVCRQP